MSVEQAVTARYTNAFVSTFDVLKPEKLPDAFKRYGNQGLNTFLLLKTLGRKRMVSAVDYSHFEWDLKRPPFQSLNVAAAAAPNTAQTITLSPANLNAANQFLPQVSDIIYYKNGQVGYIYSISVATPTAPVLTVKPVGASAAEALPAVAAGETLSIGTNGWAEGTKQPNGKASGLTEFFFNTQIIKGAIGATGTAATDQTWLRLENMPDAPLWTEAFKDLEWNQACNVGFAYTFGVPDDGTLLDPVLGKPVRLMEGMIPYANRIGNPRNYSAGAFSANDFDAYTRILINNYAKGPSMIRCGVGFAQDLENGMVNYLAGTRANYDEVAGAIEGTGITKSLSVSVGFKYITKGTQTFMVCVDEMFSDPQTVGIVGSQTPNTAVILPMGDVKVPGMNGGAPEMKKNFGYTYKGYGAYSRENEVWNLNGAGGGQYVIEDDLLNTEIRGEIGSEFFGGNSWIVITPN